MPRERLTLDGVWDFRVEGAREALGRWRRIEVPRPWQSTAEDLRDVTGTGVYRRSFTIPGHWAGDLAVLRFGAVNYFAEVAVDGEVLARHEGGFLPFEVKLPPRLTLGAPHELNVRVTIPEDDPARFPYWPFNEIPHGKQSWYGKLGGIWQSVALERRRKLHIVSCRINASLKTGEVKVGLKLSRASRAPVTLRLVAPSGTETLTRTKGVAESTLHVRKPAPWAPCTPNLYHLHVGLADGDMLTQSFGFRSIEARDGRIWLNGSPITIRGALDQDYYPETIMTPPSLAFLEDQLVKAKAMGFNCLRCHIKVPDPRYYDVADRLGMLIWTDAPNFERFTPQAASRLRDTLAGMVERDFNHPCIIAWTIINEDWGTQLERDATQRKWLAQTYDWLKALDPTRLVVDNSPCWPNFHVKSDLDDFHWYYNLPDHRDEWDEITDDFCRRPLWSFSEHGDAQRRGDEPLIVSEFGNWGLPHLGGIKERGAEPWWFETGHERHDGAEVAYPHGVERRFAAYHLDRVFGSYEEFTKATQRHQFAAPKYEIESLRARPELAGYVVTELTDLHWEANGVMDMRRNPRDFAAAFCLVNGSLVIAPKLDRFAFTTGEAIDIKVAVAAGDHRFSGGVLACGGQSVAVPRIAPAGVAALPPLKVSPPRAPGRHQIALTLTDAKGRVATRSFVEVTVLSRRSVPATRIWASSEELRGRFEALGYKIARQADAQVLVTEHLDDELIERAWRGAKLLLLADDENAIPFRTALSTRVARTFPGLRVMARDGTVWRGASTSTFSFLRRDGAYAGLPGEPMLDFAFERVMPRHVLVGYRLDDWANRVHAGLLVGWVHRPAATIGARFFGKGGALVSTFRVTRDAPGADPMATALLDALVNTAAVLA